MTQQIKVVGSTQLHNFEDVKESVIFRGGNFYWRHDDINLIKVKTSEGKIHLYRKDSPLLVTTVEGELRRKIDCYNVEGVWLYKHSPSTIMLDGKVTHVNWTIQIDGTTYLKSDDRIVKDSTSNKAFLLKENAVLLNESKYGKFCYVNPTNNSVIQINNDYFLKRDCLEVMDVVDGVKVFTMLSPLDKRLKLRHLEAFSGFKDKSNPQLERYEFHSILAEYAISVPEFNFYFHKDSAAQDIAILKELQEAKVFIEIAKAKERFDRNYDEADETENNPKKWNPKYQTWPGKHRLFGNNDHMIESKSSELTGGIRYTFGVELETSGGLVDRVEADSLGFLAVGDRSIGAAEYVTPVLHGDTGVTYLETMAKIVANSCMVDKRCGLHFHVGFIKTDDDLHYHKINFNYKFAIAAIKLGALIEEELYQILPPSRHPYNYHCYSIKHYGGINKDNWKDYLGAFLFGPREDQVPNGWGPELFKQYSYGSPGRTRENELSPWCGGRYKWLNLVRAYTRSSAPTIEFRIFPGSTSFEKIYNFLLLCLAFTYVVDNKYTAVTEGKFTTLASIIEAAYTDRPDIIEKLSSFIEKRKARFNRTNVYSLKHT